MRYYTPPGDFFDWLEGQEAYTEDERETFTESLRDIDSRDGIRGFYLRSYRSIFAQQGGDVERFDALVGDWPERDMDFVPLSQAMTAATLCAAQLDTPTLTEGLQLLSARTGASLLEAFAPYQAAYAATHDDVHAFIERSDWLLSAVFNNGTARTTRQSSLGVELDFTEISGAFFISHLVAGGVPAFFSAMGIDLVSIESRALSRDHVNIRYSISPIRRD